jgi:hypothetical protein
MLENSSADRQRSEGLPRRQRSAVSNGSRLFVEGDDRSAWSRRYRDLIIAHTADLGGAAVLSEAKLSLIRRASAIEVELEQSEGRLSMGEQIDLDAFTRAASHLRRLFEALGLERQARDVTLIDGTVEAPWSPMRERLRAEAVAAAKEDLAP